MIEIKITGSLTKNLASSTTADYANLRFVSLEMITNNQFMFVMSLAYFDVGNKLVARIVTSYAR